MGKCWFYSLADENQGPIPFQLHCGTRPISGRLLAFLRLFCMDQVALQHWLDSSNCMNLLHEECGIETEVEDKCWSFLTARCRLLLRLYPTTIEVFSIHGFCASSYCPVEYFANCSLSLILCSKIWMLCKWIWVSGTGCASCCDSPRNECSCPPSTTHAVNATNDSVDFLPNRAYLYTWL